MTLIVVKFSRLALSTILIIFSVTSKVQQLFIHMLIVQQFGYFIYEMRILVAHSHGARVQFVFIPLSVLLPIFLKDRYFAGEKSFISINLCLFWQKSIWRNQFINF
jgi:hypothetical protein